MFLSALYAPPYLVTTYRNFSCASGCTVPGASCFPGKRWGLVPVPVPDTPETAYVSPGFPLLFAGLFFVPQNRKGLCYEGQHFKILCSE